MTSQEMALEFDILYNNIASNMAPGIDAYEKSVFLTKAQEQIVTAIYDGSFEGSEKLRECINPLVVTEECKEDSTKRTGVENNSKFFVFPKEAWYIVYEYITLTSDNHCDNGRRVAVKPVLVDEYHRIRRNPFRRARKDEVLRLNTEGVIEIVTSANYKNYTYTMRYLRRPKPIIIGTGDASLTINDNKSTEFDSDYNGQGSELLTAIHRTIVETAVNLAIAAYKSTNN